MSDRRERPSAPVELDIDMAGARSRVRLARAEAALRRDIVLGAQVYRTSGPVERECVEALLAYEQILTYAKGHKSRALRLRARVREYGILGAVERAVLNTSLACDYRPFKQLGLEDLAFEAVVLRYPDQFSPEAVECARGRLDAGSKRATR